MDISVPSRFACLKIEDDEMRPSNNRKKSEKIARKPVPKKSAGPATNTKQSSSTAKKPKSKQIEKQWEDWKRKDGEMVDDNFQQDLQKALYQSKLDYETQKTAAKSDDKAANKKKKNKTMALTEFLEGSGNKKPLNGGSEEVVEKEQDDAFFEMLRQQTKKELLKGKVEEERKDREVDIEKVISIAQCQEKLKLERQRNADLQRQLEKAKAEVVTVKARNKMLCTILGQGEMKDKAEILRDLERLTVVKDELTEEVSKLHKLLEQERSKSGTAESAASKHKDKKRKKIA